MASGFQALFSNTTGIYDTATGPQALYKNTTAMITWPPGFARCTATRPATVTRVMV
jgi:hypothetical protein